MLKPRKVAIEIHDARLELPDHSAECLTFSATKDGSGIYNVSQVRYSLKYKCFCVGDESAPPSDERRATWADVRFWAYYEPLKAKLEKGIK